MRLAAAQQAAAVRAEKAQAAARKAAARARGAMEKQALHDMFAEQFAEDAQAAAQRLRKFSPDETIIASQLVAVDDIKITDMDDGSSVVYVKYQMQKLHKGDGDPRRKSASKWFKVRRTEQGFERLAE